MNDAVEIPPNDQLPPKHVLEAELEKRRARDRRWEKKRPVRPDRHKGRSVAKLQKMMITNMTKYKVDALDALHELAMMDESKWEKNSQLAHVKMLAARMLAFPDNDQAPQTNFGDTLRQLNDEYHKVAPRIKSVRERVITFEDEKLISEAVPQE